MIVSIKSISIGADDKEGNIYEYWINGILESGMSILILDRWGNRGNKDVAQYVNKKIDCLIIVSEISDLRIEKLLKIDTITDRFHGKYLGEYDVPKYWEYKPISPDDAIETIDGIFLLYKKYH